MSPSAHPSATTGLAVRAWGVTLGLCACSLLGAAAVAATGAPLPAVVGGVGGLCVLAVAAARSGGRFAFDAGHARPLRADELRAVRRAARDVAERAGRPVPRLVVMEMDAPGAVVGYDDGRPVVAVDPLLPRVVGEPGLRALLAHELGHLGNDLYTDALRQYAPQTLGFCALWLGGLAGRGPALATLGTLCFLALSVSEARLARWPRYALGGGVEPLALAASRYANRCEEYRADAAAASLVDAATLADALYRVAAVATGENLEDVAGPIPWNADRSLRFACFATHPSVESRVERLGCEIPAWARPYEPHRDA
ncbi:M48 family metalloprotease (plasmid) [Halarchaeum sp. CBA1220]|uniref:M48 family metallopeptidase n=1 Tax=Halarchaeum sp. CBA1220 TaxID=1853682 RepID=UPI000F3A9838|nr:M48 family metalloprotease [Halarchaeum sp. CBA1220]QLC35174.1 M48 family metalloprotease [Halarchaeum sp. CBA1220]